MTKQKTQVSKESKKMRDREGEGRKNREINK
jgi:hypothetical protein